VNRIMRSKLSIIAVVLFLPLILMGCGSNCYLCHLGCSLCGIIQNLFGLLCYFGCLYEHCPDCPPVGTPPQACAENPDENAATFEQMEIEAIEYCEEYPDECQQAFDTWIESLEEEAIE